MFCANTFGRWMGPVTTGSCGSGARIRRWIKAPRLRELHYGHAALSLAAALLLAASAGAQTQSQNSRFDFVNFAQAQNGPSSGFQSNNSTQAQEGTTSNLHFSSSNSSGDLYFHRWSANIGGGFSPLLGDIHSRLNNGWHVTGGAAYRFNHYLSLGGQVMYNGFRVSDRVLNEAAVPDGNSHLWAFTAQPMLEFAPRHGFNPYLVGGVGYYRRVVQFTRPTVVQIDIFDPFFFGVFPVLVPANQVLGTITDDGIGGNAGVGVNWRIGDSDAQVFLEARYHYADVGSIITRMIPITLGLRF